MRESNQKKEIRIVKLKKIIKSIPNLYGGIRSKIKTPLYDEHSKKYWDVLFEMGLPPKLDFIKAQKKIEELIEELELFTSIFKNIEKDAANIFNSKNDHQKNKIAIEDYIYKLEETNISKIYGGILFQYFEKCLEALGSYKLKKDLNRILIAIIYQKKGMQLNLEFYSIKIQNQILKESQIKGLYKNISFLEMINKRALNLIKSGENNRVELKSTFQIDDKTGNQEFYLINAILKIACSFANTYGGDIFIGVADNGKILGIERDLKFIALKNDFPEEELINQIEGILEINFKGMKELFIVEILKLKEKKIVNIRVKKGVKHLEHKGEILVKRNSCIEHLEKKELENSNNFNLLKLLNKDSAYIKYFKYKYQLDKLIFFNSDIKEYRLIINGHKDGISQEIKEKLFKMEKTRLMYLEIKNRNEMKIFNLIKENSYNSIIMQNFLPNNIREFIDVVEIGETKNVFFLKSYYGDGSKEVKKNNKLILKNKLDSFIGKKGYIIIGINESGELIGIENDLKFLLENEKRKNICMVDKLYRVIDDSIDGALKRKKINFFKKIYFYNLDIIVISGKKFVFIKTKEGIC